MPDHTHFMTLAIELARTCIQSPDGRPFGAVIVIDGAVVGSGMNETVARSDPTAHAEVMAIRDACARLHTQHLPPIPPATLYASSEPCPLCLAASMWAGIREIYYGCSVEEAETLGFSDKAFYDQLKLPREKRTIRSYPLLSEQGRAVVAEFDENRKKGLVRGWVSE